MLSQFLSYSIQKYEIWDYTQIFSFFLWKLSGKEFPLWQSGNKSNWYTWGCRFDPWPLSVGGGSGVAMSCGIGQRCGSEPALLWLWHRPATIAPIQPQVWELPYAVSAALKKAHTHKKKKERERLFLSFSHLESGEWEPRWVTSLSLIGI